MRRARARRRRMRVATGPASGSAATSSAETPSSTLSRDTTVSSRSSAASSAHGATSASTAARSTIGSTATPASRRISRPRAWNVRTRTSPGATPSGATAASSRSVISSAARLLKVIARIAPGGVPVAMSHAARATRVVVLPLPAGAMHSHGPGGAVAAACWSVREPGETLGDRGMEVHPRSLPSLALSAAYPALAGAAVAPAARTTAIHGPFTWCYRRRCTVASWGHDPLRRGPRRHGRPRW